MSDRLSYLDSGELFRSSPASVDAGAVRIERDGGQFGSGLLRGVSLITHGVAAGHYAWIDEETLAQVASFDGDELKSRFTHPTWENDGLGSYLGRITDLRVEGNRVLGDLHFAKSAHISPSGNLADYLMTLAEEDATAAGLSIVFHHDRQSEVDFVLRHGARWNDGLLDLSGFQSPDPGNVLNYPHVRLQTLLSADVVDQPAANPLGLFQKGSSMSETTSPTPTTPPAPAQPETPAVDPEALRAEVEQQTRETVTRYMETFGHEAGSRYFADGLEYTTACETHIAALGARIEAAEERADQAEQKLASLSTGEDEPVETGKPKREKTMSFGEYTRGGK